jgi:hypothetical protein
MRPNAFTASFFNQLLGQNGRGSAGRAVPVRRLPGFPARSPSLAAPFNTGFSQFPWAKYWKPSQK